MTDDLLQRWHANKSRPAWVRRHSDELETAADLAAADLEIPQSLPDIEDWLAGYKSVVTRRLQTNSTDDQADSEQEARN